MGRRPAAGDEGAAASTVVAVFSFRAANTGDLPESCDMIRQTKNNGELPDMDWLNEDQRALRITRAYFPPEDGGSRT